MIEKSIIFTDLQAWWIQVEWLLHLYLYTGICPLAVFNPPQHCLDLHKVAHRHALALRAEICTLQVDD